MLLEAGQPAAALQEYEASQQREPNRYRGYYGAALAAAKAGDRERAKANFDRLVKLTAKGKPRPEMNELRKIIASN